MPHVLTSTLALAIAAVALDPRPDARAEARRIVAGDTTDSRIHVAGCERACGAPHSPHTLVLARSSP